MSTRFPESGGAYTFAKRVLSVRAAFGAGWILWFAYIVAGVLYALGFASYAVELIRILFYHSATPEWLQGRTPVVILALIPTVLYSASLIRHAAGGGQWATWGKICVFVVLLLVGFWALGTSDFETSRAKLVPFFPEGMSGLFQAMGLTFIALQGFDLIAAIAGEVKDPGRNIPRAMLLSLGAALVIYLPLLLIVSTVGTPDGQSVTQMSADNPETIMAVAVRRFMGPLGYWLVMIAALLSTLSALQANLLAASRIAQSMAEDRTLPAVLATIHPKLGTPHMAIYASTLTLVALLLAVPDLASAGAAASLIFLIAFALSHWTSILARKRDEADSSAVERFSALPSQGPPISSSTTHLKPSSHPPSSVGSSEAALLGPGESSQIFQAPCFPLVPVVGGVACVFMAVFQALAEPAAGGIAAVWLGLGGLLYVALFSNRAETYDAFAEARDPALARMRGRSPLVLVPVANPKTVHGMVEVAAALAPPHVGRVLLLRVMLPPQRQQQSPGALQEAHSVLTQALTTALESGHRPEGLVTIAPKPWREIGRVVRSHGCRGLVLGLPTRVSDMKAGPVEQLLNDLDCDVTLVRCDEGWRPRYANRILVPIGRRGHDIAMRARVLGSLHTDAAPQITWVTIIPTDTTELGEAQTRRYLLQLARDNVYGDPTLLVVRDDNPIEALATLADDHELLVLGMHRSSDGKRLFGDFNTAVVERTTIATLIIGGGG